jgi:hypothetical protein
MYSRAIGLITALAAASLYNWLPRDTSAAISAALSPVPPGQGRLSVSVLSQALELTIQQRVYNSRRTTALMPVAVAGLSSDANARFDQVSLVLTTADGEQYEAEGRGDSDSILKNHIVAQLNEFNPGGPLWQSLDFYNPAVWSKLQRGPVTLRGRMFVSFYRSTDSTTLEPGQHSEAPDLRCVNAMSVDPRNSFGLSTLDCESPETAPRNIRLGLQENGYVSRRGYLREHRFFGPSPYPADPWLSPLWKSADAVQGDRGRATFVVTPQIPLGSAVIDYTIPDLDLNRFVVHEPVKPEARP